MKGADEFVALVGVRERALAALLFAAGTEGGEAADSLRAALDSLP
jgi:Ca2+/Na+ antiporter